jgi:hypothetical protein
LAVPLDEISSGDGGVVRGQPAMLPLTWDAVLPEPPA